MTLWIIFYAKKNTSFDECQFVVAVTAQAR